MKGCLRENFCIHAEKVKSIEALQGSAHSQECLACLSLTVGRPGKTNYFTSSFARINKQWRSLEAKGNWTAFCFNYGTALVRARISCHEVRKFPGPGSCAGLCTSWQCLGCAAQGAQNLHCLLLKHLISVAFPWTVCKCTQAFLWRTLQFPSWLRQAWEWVDDLAVLSAFRVFCSSLPLAPFCPQWDVSAFSPFSRNTSITTEMWCYTLDLTGTSSGVILRGDGGNALSHLHHESTQHRIIDPSHLAITEQGLRLWTCHCPALAVWLSEQFSWMAVLAEKMILVTWRSSPFRHE